MSTELVKYDDYKVLALPAERYTEIVQESLQLGMTVADLDRVVSPSGTAKTFEVQTPLGPKPETELIGVVLHTAPRRAYWANDIDEGRSAPDCVSLDMHEGHGDPGGDCLECPHNEFGSKGRGKACGEYLHIYLLRKEQKMPTIVRVPTASVKEVKKYLLGLWNLDVAPHTVESRFTLETDRSGDGISFPRFKVAMTRRLDDDAIDRAGSFKEALQALLKTERAIVSGDGAQK